MLIWDGGLPFHSILSKIVVEITLRCTGCEEKKFVSVNDLCALTQSKNRMTKEFRVYWRHRRHSTVKYRGLLSLSTQTGVSVSFLLVLNWNFTDFIREKINSVQQWEDPKVSVQLVDKYRSLAKAIQNRTKLFCSVLFAIIVSQTEDRERGVFVCFRS